ncbi:uncharacterized protein PV09_04639 [Verruconis gallopava]|uniref:Uncharacterized protein n=1 Tax=Verruconis gallopava TaxID=253628 RepID=A0A0D2AD21_9PEZI|nr:uncharacterized protein PV09_04639 [Verruconis gallopava]KIW04350.1 hypothetical protein PV09_04639 [Verruconis gallopava]
MANSRRFKIVAVSIVLIIIFAITLDAALRLHAPPHNILKVSHAQNGGPNLQAAKAGAEPQQSGTGQMGSPSNASVQASSAATHAPTHTTGLEQGLIGSPSNTTAANATATAQVSVSMPSSSRRPESDLSIILEAYAGSAGPKRCRGQVLKKLIIPHPVSQWRSGVCVNLSDQAQCGIFYAGKEDNCEARLFNIEGCEDTTDTYVNTVVFMPEVRAVGSLWRSMFIRCGIDVPEVGQLDPSILGAALKLPSAPNTT